MIKLFQFGPMGSGKDFVAEYLDDQHGFLTIALADGMREYISHNNPDYVWKSSRALEIDVGEKHREWFGADFWCKQTERRIDSLTGYIRDYPGVIIRDGRFEHEYDFFVKKRGYQPLKIVASNFTRIKRLANRDGQVDTKHFENPKDCPIIGMDGYEIYNNDDAAATYAQLDKLVASLRKKGGRSDGR